MQRIGFERRPTDQRLVDDQAQAILIAERRGRLAARLFRRDIIGRALKGVGTAFFAMALKQLGDPEVGQIGVAVCIEQDVGWFHVPMDDAVAMGHVQRGRHLVDQLRNPVERPAAIGYCRLEIATTQIAHHQKGPARFAPEVVERNDVGVLQSGDGLRLDLKAADEVGVIGIARRNDFDCYLPLDGWLRGAKDSVEAAAPQLLDDLIAPD